MRLIKPLIREIHLFDSYIAGTTHLKDKSVLETIQVGDVLNLQREDMNKYDSNAILVLNEEKKKLGYVPEKDNSRSPPSCRPDRKHRRGETGGHNALSFFSITAIRLSTST